MKFVEAVAGKFGQDNGMILARIWQSSGGNVAIANSFNLTSFSGRKDSPNSH
jgi:hypothetical protein